MRYFTGSRALWTNSFLPHWQMSAVVQEQVETERLVVSSLKHLIVRGYVNLTDINLEVFSFSILSTVSCHYCTWLFQVSFFQLLHVWAHLLAPCVVLILNTLTLLTYCHPPTCMLRLRVCVLYVFEQVCLNVVTVRLMLFTFGAHSSLWQLL